MTGGWIAEALVAPLVQVLPELGLEVRRGRVHPCPACNESTRSSSDRTLGPVGVTNNGAGWCCHRCGAKGDAIDAAAHVLQAARFRALGVDAQGSVRAWFAARGWCSAAPGAAPAPAPIRPRPTPTPAPSTPSIDASEVRALWDACLPLDAPATTATLAQRDVWCALARWGLGPAAIAIASSLDVARALSPDALPAWATCAGQPWSDGWGLVLPVWSPTGELAGLRARWTYPHGSAPGGRKEVAARGSRSAGSAYACPMGRALLRGERTIVDDAGRLEWDGRVVVCEGGKDAIVWRCHDGAHPVLGKDGTWRTFAVLGAWSGSWSAELAARIPDGALVSIATDADEKGDVYAAQIATSLGDRCRTVRWRPPRAEAA